MRPTTKTRAPPSLSKLFTFFAAVFFTLFLLRLRFNSAIPSAVVRDAAASIVHRPSDRFFGIPKIAFLFLARGDLPLDFLWQGFFQVRKRAFRSPHHFFFLNSYENEE
ncbi:hypothetical protein ACLOJK_011038 [Asimina triloba]